MPSFIIITIVSNQSSESVRISGQKVRLSTGIVHISFNGKSKEIMLQQAQQLNNQLLNIPRNPQNTVDIDSLSEEDENEND